MRMAGVNITYEVEIADRTMAKYIEDHIWAYDLIKGLLPEAIIGKLLNSYTCKQQYYDRLQCLIIFGINYRLARIITCIFLP